MKGLPDNKLTEFAAMAKSAREKLGWSQARVANEARQKQSTVAKIETCGSYSLSALTAVLFALGYKEVMIVDPVIPRRPAGVKSPAPAPPPDSLNLAQVERFIMNATPDQLSNISQLCVYELNRRARGKQP